MDEAQKGPAGRGDPIAADAPAAVEPPPRLARGTLVHRYVVRDEVGSGAMGVVYAADDSGLDRKVALKLVREPRQRPGHRRLLREAQALAKLSHPNVVTVYDVGTHLDQVFVAMEFVEGQTLRAWLAEKPRSWREVVDAFLRAGEGLAAAHEAGIVHRDFKPDNVLVDRQGRVRVGDFGLAFIDQESDDEEEGEREVAGGASRIGEGSAPPGLDPRLTASGAAIGTLAYMAPEQQAGRAPVDARADQFSFCVALHEALHGERPFGGDSQPEIAEHIARGEVREAPRGRDVPAWLRRVVLRGLASDPSARYPSMAALLADLRRDPATRRRRIAAAAAGALLVGAAVAGVAALQRADEPPCRGAAGKLAGVWDGPRKQLVQRAFLAGGSGGRSAWTEVESALDRHAGAWVAMHTASCEATHVREEQPAAVLDLRTECLDRNLAELRALTDVLAAADAGAIERAGNAAESLPPLDQCADVAALRLVVPSPRDAGARARLAELRARNARARALRATGKYREGLELARALAADARALGYRPLEADALMVLGMLLRENDKAAEAEEVLYEAIAAGEAGRNGETTADAWLELLWVVGATGTRHQEALRLTGLARSAIERLGGSKRTEAALESTIGYLYQDMGKLEEARPYIVRGLAMNEKVHGADSLRVTPSIQHLGILEQRLGNLDEALRLFRRAREMAEKAEGPEHPLSISYLGDEASALRSLGREEESLRLFERGLASLEAAGRAESNDTLFFLTGIGKLRQSKGDLAGAEATLRRAVALAERLHGPDHPQVGQVNMSLAMILADRKQRSAALAAYRRTLSILERAFGADSGELVKVHFHIAQLYIDSEPKRAVAPLERALALRERGEGNPLELAYCRYELAKALHRSGRRGARVRKLVAAAIPPFLEADDKQMAARLRRWLRGPGRKPLP
ncbi:MAG TPA: serine/threonine-protein kinase [Kofleriaceae bacterium]|nr:serine/threonine-protein kinase [Kofleriaceae bacterium]